MRHSRANRKLSLKKNPRTALLRSLVLNLIDKERIMTSEIKAKELRRKIEPLVTLAKRGDVASARIISARIFNSKSGVAKLMKTIGPRYKERAGGYTRVVKMAPRKTDGAKMAIIEFV